MSHCSAIGDALSCDAPYSAIGFRGNIFLRCPLVRSALGCEGGHFYGKKWGCSSDSLRYHREHSAIGVLYTCLAIGGGGYFGRVTKSLSEYGVEGFEVWLRRLSEDGSFAYLIERSTWEAQAE